MSAKKPYSTERCSPLSKLTKPLENGLRRLTVPTRDFLRNRRYVRSDRKIAIVRHQSGLPSYYKSFLSWTAQCFPEVREALELHLLPCNLRDSSKYSLVVPWIPDTLLYRSRRVRQQAIALTAAADSHGVPVINRPEHLLSTSKHDCGRKIAHLGVRTPWSHRITDIAGFQRDLQGLNPPLLVREDLAHGGWSPVFLVRQPEDVQKIPLEKFAEPIAVEFIDVRSPTDGLVRKYRYMSIGATGVAHTLQISKRWEVRSGSRVLNEQTIQEEIAYADSLDPHHEVLQHVSRGLGLDFLAYDYSLDQQGQLVVWEINVLPGLGIPTAPGRKHLIPPIERAMAATLKLYLDRAALDIPSRLNEFLEVSPRTQQIDQENRSIPPQLNALTTAGETIPT
ncbi:MAG: hypothetical protein GY768_32610 [Planctomycetaceae bacterium]|nr:hypothetical protein [Planctomycetaceae bacterium]